MGLGTWSWGNQFLWGYKESMDTELQEVRGAPRAGRCKGGGRASNLHVLSHSRAAAQVFNLAVSQGAHTAWHAINWPACPHSGGKGICALAHAAFAVCAGRREPV